MVDGDYKFLWVDVGVAGSSSDFQNDLRHKIEDGIIGFPKSESLVDDGPKVNFFIPLKLWLMKPYSRRGMEAESLQLQDQPGKEGW